MLNSTNIIGTFTKSNKSWAGILMSSLLAILFLIINVFSYAELNGLKPALTPEVTGPGQTGTFNPDVLRIKISKTNNEVSRIISSLKNKDKTLVIRPSQSFSRLNKSPLHKGNRNQWPFTHTAAIPPNRREIMSGERHTSGEKESTQDS